MRGSLSMSQSERGREGWGDYVKSRATKRSMGNGRLIGSALSLILGAGLIYTSLFYVPAFFDGSPFGEQRRTVEPPAEPGTMDKFTGLLKSPRGLVQGGQSLSGQFSFSRPVTAEFTLMRCTAPAGLQVYRCAPEEVASRVVKAKDGSLTFTPTETGFYQIRLTVTGDMPAYHVVWARQS